MAKKDHRILVLLEQFADGQCEPELFLDTPEGRGQMDATFRKRVRDNIGEQGFDGEVRKITDSEIENEIEHAVQNKYLWAGWDCKVQTVRCKAPR